MRRFAIVLLVLMVAIGASVVTMGAVGEREDRGLNPALDTVMQAWNSGDVDAFWEHVDPSLSGFSFRQDLLGSLSKEAFQGLYDAGYQVRVVEKHRRTHIYGDTAVATSYIEGAITLPGDVVMTGTWRMSSVWVLRDAGWRMAHYHHSPLVSEVVTDGGAN
ncbi:SnoaL-like domain-containing protein [Candidatus Poribacteria bacterium]|jgi:hypothetical protein|nr:SnoaL-like domain-containing protein [Candidatus Poribacteria bacterium]MBT5532269.1 SnoaL-like domain-containing protein [Candidatus Poribacteria bacterium]MBT5709415.1 SnoaL-like domain-containing protein [Candidatus Poribacteria bacterium]MBT7100483.1 SnoaL-like domain-containing protein [Candidatus Poribacteria bacterium]